MKSQPLNFTHRSFAIASLVLALSACSGEADDIANSAPVATNLSISNTDGGAALVGEQLTAVYSYSDAEGDAEGQSRFRWFRNDVAISGATSNTYTLLPEDSQKDLRFEVTPVAVSGTLVGQSTLSSIVVIGNLAPTASNVTAVDSNGGQLLIGDTLTGSYTFNDIDGDAEGLSTYRWFRGTQAIAGATQSSYTTVEADSGYMLYFEITPVSSTGTTLGTAVSSGGVTPNTLPVISDILIVDTNGSSPIVGDTLSGGYVYFDTENDPQGSTSVRWLRNGVAIPGATNSTYITTIDDLGKEIVFEVTLAASTGSTMPVVATSPGLTIVNVAPIATGVGIVDSNGGALIVGDSLTGNYTYSDEDGDSEGTSTFRWLRNGVAIPGATSIGYSVTAAEAGTNISFEVTPIAATGVTTGTAATSGALGVNEFPTATSLSIVDNNGGRIKAGDVLSGSYTYSDLESDAEGTSTFRWLRNGVAIPGETTTSYAVSSADFDQALQFEVTPVAATGSTNGVATLSAVTQGPSTNNNLSGINLSASALDQTFDPAQLDYTATVGFLAASLQLTVPTEHPGASVKVNTMAVDSLNRSQLLALAEGANAAINIEVTSEANTVQAYTLTPTREVASTLAERVYVKASNSGIANTSYGDEFGYSLAIDGDTIAIGARYESSAATGIDGDQTDNSKIYAGAVYVFTRSGGTWSQQAYIKASNTDLEDYFGCSVALDGDTLVVGACGEDSASTTVNGDQGGGKASSGAAYVYIRSGTTWSQQAYLKASNSGTGDNFGSAVAIHGDTLAVGARLEDSSATDVDGDQTLDNATDSGAVYVFIRSGTSWSQQAYIKASNTGLNDKFGKSVALEGDTLAVGAHQEGSSSTGINSTPNDDLSPSSVGAVYVFTRTGTSWAQEAYIKSSNPGSNDNFGYAVDLSGDTLAVGAWGEEGTSSGVGGNPALTGSASAGAVFIFTRSGSTWSPQEYIKAKTTSSSERFGWSVSLDKDTLVVGAPGEKAASTNTGAINVYTRSGTTWTLHSEHNTSNKQQSDEFGWAVGVSGDTIVGSAFHEDSNETGTTGTGADNSMSNSGAAYIFQ